MEKKDAVRRFQETNFQSIPAEWVEILMKANGREVKLPMWGTMWIVEEFWGRKLATIMSKVMQDWDNTKSQDWNDRNAHGELYGERAIIDRDGIATNMFIYQLDGRYLLGVHGCGYDFFDGVWDVLYDLFELKWHEADQA